MLVQVHDWKVVTKCIENGTDKLWRIQKVQSRQIGLGRLCVGMGIGGCFMECLGLEG